MADDLDHAVNVHLTATEHDDSIVFLHNVHDGPASQSYGLQVAKLAGVPQDVIRNAKTQLAHLEGLEAGSNPSPAPVSVNEPKPLRHLRLRPPVWMQCTRRHVCRGRAE